MLPNLDFQIHSDENDINIKFLNIKKEKIYTYWFQQTQKSIVSMLLSYYYYLKLNLYISVYKSIKEFADF